MADNTPGSLTLQAVLYTILIAVTAKLTSWYIRRSDWSAKRAQDSAKMEAGLESEYLRALEVMRVELREEVDKVRAEARECDKRYNECERRYAQLSMQYEFLKAKFEDLSSELDKLKNRSIQ